MSLVTLIVGTCTFIVGICKFLLIHTILTVGSAVCSIVTALLNATLSICDYAANVIRRRNENSDTHSTNNDLSS